MGNKEVKIGNIIRCINPHTKCFGFEEGTFALVKNVKNEEYVVMVLDFDGTFPIGNDNLCVPKTDFEYYGEDFTSSFPEKALKINKEHEKYCEERRSRELNSNSNIFLRSTYTVDQLVCPYNDCNAKFDKYDIQKIENKVGDIGWMKQKEIKCPCCNRTFYVVSFIHRSFTAKIDKDE